MKPIETVYQGYRFRSRLEARWAVCLDALGWPWEYEPEGFVLPNGAGYLPDFVLRRPHAAEGGRVGEAVCFLEIKPTMPTADELMKAWHLQQGTGVWVFFGIGLPDAQRLAQGLHGIDERGELQEGMGSIHQYTVGKWGRPGLLLDDDPSDADFDACAAARAARFEFGERGRAR